MVLTASLCDALHINEFELCKQCICHRVAPGYAADLPLPILDRGRNTKERVMGSSTIYSVHVLT